MRRSVAAACVVGVLAVAVAIGLPARAAAQDGDGELGGTARERIVGSAIASVLITVPTTIAFGLMDLHYVGQDRRVPVGWATFQGVAAAIDVMISVILLEAGLNHGDTRAAIFGGALTLTSAALLGVAIHQLTRAAEPGPPPPADGQRPAAW